MRNIKLLISYDGTDFFGWQRQPGRRTVQEELGIVLTRLTGREPDTNVSGRTDAGVHAIGQVVQFYSPTHQPTETILKATNAMLPPDIRVLGAWDMPQSFHATLDARSKTYRYVFDNAPIADPFHRRYATHVFHRMDVDLMRRAAQALVGTHDFHSFETNWPNRTSSVRTVYRLDVTRHDRFVHIEVEANGFLYNMVRAIAGTLALIGTGRRPESFAGDALAAEDRTAAGATAAPHGLFLLRVRYERE